MSKKTQTPAIEATEPSAPAPADVWYVVDSTATFDNPRTHEQVIDGRPKAFKFVFGEPLALPPAIAMKFLRHAAFIRTDKDGKAIDHKRAPTQPEDLGAGEQLVLKDDETIARYDEMTTQALYYRAIVLPGGEAFSKGDKPDRAEMIEFIIRAKAKARKDVPAPKAPDVLMDDEMMDEPFEEEAA